MPASVSPPMRFLPLRLVASLLVCSLSSSAAFAQAAPAPSPATPVVYGDNARPYLTVYRWGVSGLERGFYDSYPGWLNRSVLWAEDFQATQTWDDIRNPRWQLEPWGRWVNAVYGRRLVLSIPLLPGEWDRRGPTRGTDAGVPVSLEHGAAGQYNAHFRLLAQKLVEHGLGDTILRLGWEFNGGWYAWRAMNQEAAFAEYFRQIVTTMRAVPGAEDLKFCWNPNNNVGQSDARKAWPGREFVDYIGIDVYDQSWAPETYPIPKDASPEETQRRRERAWRNWIVSEERHGLNFWRKFAEREGRPLCLPEWGVAERKDGHGGGDNAYFIRQMHAFIHDPANNIAWHCYFDVDPRDPHHQLSPFPDGRPTKFPRAAEAFHELFRLWDSPPMSPSSERR